MVSGIENSTMYKQSLDTIMRRNNGIEEEDDNVSLFYMILEEMACQKNLFGWCWEIGLGVQTSSSVLSLHYKYPLENLQKGKLGPLLQATAIGLTKACDV